MKSEHTDSPIEEKPVTTTSQETKRQSQDSFVKVSEVMKKVDERQEAGISVATCSQDKGISSDDQSFQGWMGIMRAEEMEVLNDEENRDFYLAVSSGNVKKARSMLERNADLAKIKIQNGMLPIHIAASWGHERMLRFLYDRTKPDDLEWEQNIQLFFTTIKNNMYDVAFKMLLEYPELADSRYEELTALHVLARKQYEDKFDDIGQPHEMDLTWLLWVLTTRKEHNEMLEFISKPSRVLFEAAKSGNFLIIAVVLLFKPELVMELDSQRRTLLHIAILYRRAVPLYLILTVPVWANLLKQVVDVNGNNILHMVGMMSPHGRFEFSRSDIQMHRELLWFKEVEKIVPAEFKSKRNHNGQTPKEVFYSTYRDLMVKAEVAMKDKANYGMLVATIIATIVFAASLTVPGHDVSPEADSSILQKKGWYIIFILSDAVALCFSSTSIIIFLTVLTSSYTEDEFNILLLLRLFGVVAVFVAVTTMFVAFVAACFLIFNHHSTWVAYVVALLGFLPVALFYFLFYALLGELTDIMYLSHPYAHVPRLTENDQRPESHMTVFVGLMKWLAFKIPHYLRKMCQNAKAKLRFQVDNPVAEP